MKHLKFLVSIVLMASLASALFAQSAEKNDNENIINFKIIRETSGFIFKTLEESNAKVNDLRTSNVFERNQTSACNFDLNFICSSTIFPEILKKIGNFSPTNSDLAYQNISADLCNSTDIKFVKPISVRISMELLIGSGTSEDIRKANMSAGNFFEKVLQRAVFRNYNEPEETNYKIWLSSLRAGSDGFAYGAGYSLDSDTVYELGQWLLLSKTLSSCNIPYLNKTNFNNQEVIRFDFSGKMF